MARIPGLKEEMEPLPPDVYEVRVAEFKEKETVAGDPMWSVRLIVTEDGPYQGRAIFDNFVIFKDPTKRFGIKNLGQFLKAADVEVDDEGDFEPADAFNAELKVSTDLIPDKTTGEPREKVARYLPLG